MLSSGLFSSHEFWSSDIGQTESDAYEPTVHKHWCAQEPTVHKHWCAQKPTKHLNEMSCSMFTTFR